MKNGKKGTALDSYRNSIRDKRVKLTNSAALELIRTLRVGFSHSTWEILVPLLLRVESLSLRRLLPRKVEYWNQIQLPIDVPKVNLIMELRLCLVFFQQSNEILISFRNLVTLYENSYIIGNKDRCCEILADIQDKTGYSLWLLRTTIHHAATFEGLEIQKERAHSIIRMSPRSLVSFLSWQTSERNEEKVSVAGFSRRMRETIEQDHIAKWTQAFLLRELINELPADADALGGLLFSNFQNSVVDYYECAVAILTKVASVPALQNELGNDVADIASGFFNLAADRRLKKVAIAINFTFQPGFDPSIFQESKEVDGELANVDISTVESVLLARPIQHFSNESAHILSLLDDYRNVVTRSAKRDDIYPRMEKFFTNASHLCLTESFRQGYERRSLPTTELVPFSKYSSEFTANFNPSGWTGSEKLAHWTGYLGIFSKRPSIDAAQQDLTVVATLSEAERFLLSERLRSLLETFDADNLEGWLTTTVGIIVWHPTMFREVNSKILEDHIVANLAKWRGSITASIFLHHRIKITAKQRLDSKLQLLVKWVLELPSGLACHAHLNITQDQAFFVYFLRYVCSQKNLTLLAAVNRSSDRRRERMAICRRLIEMDSSNSSAYEDEIKDLTLDDLKEEGLHNFDQSRVFVNVIGLREIALVEYTEAYERFCDLSTIPEGNVVPSVDVLRDLIRANKEGKEVLKLQASMSEVKTVFLDMLHGLADIYLNNPVHGLDSFLSLRIRHGSMASSIRGPLEEAQLITSHGKSTNIVDYERNEYWITGIGLAADESDAVDRLLRTFSRSIDLLISTAVSQYVQIHGPDHQKGAFRISLPEETIASLAEQGRVMRGANEFFNLCFKRFGFALTPCLAKMRSTIEDEIKTPLDSMLSKLAIDLSLLVGQQRASSFTHVVNQSRVAIQQAVDRVIGWFQLRDTIDSTRTYSIEELVEVCIAIARNTHTGFTPIVTPSISSRDRKLRVMSHLMHPFSDAVFIMIDNVYKHSGLSAPPEISLTIGLCETSALQIKCESQVAPIGPNRAAVEQRLSEIKDQISSFQISNAANLEGGTGLLKLRKLAGDVVLKDRNKAIEFGFVGDESFSVTVHLPVEIRSAQED